MLYTVRNSESVAVASAAAPFAAMSAGVQYKLYSSTDAWYRIVAPASGSVAAAAGAGSHPIKAGTSVLVAAYGTATIISIIRASADGTATLSEMVRLSE